MENNTLFFLFNVNAPSTGIRFFHRAFTEKSGNRSCTFANNEIANNCSMSYCKIMMHIIFSKASTRTSCVDNMTRKGNDGLLGNSSTRATRYLFCVEIK